MINYSIIYSKFFNMNFNESCSEKNKAQYSPFFVCLATPHLGSKEVLIFSKNIIFLTVIGEY